MPGIFSTSGMSLRIPAGALRLYADGRAEVSHVELASDFGRTGWPSREITSPLRKSTMRQCLSLTSARRGQERPQARGGIPRRTIIYFRSSVRRGCTIRRSQRATPGDALIDIGGDDTARYQYVTETLRRGSRFSNEQVKVTAEFVELLFKLRGLAVHPPADFRVAEYHDDIDQGS
jgi:hypothetical protein